jgi:plasmid stabilization system protein ParE
VVTKRKVIWPQLSKQQLREAYNHIKKDAPASALKVRKSIVNATIELVNHPNKNAADKFKMDNDGSFRAFELFRYRIAYQVTETEIIILRVRHTSMEPLKY